MIIIETCLKCGATITSDQCEYCASSDVNEKSY